MKHVISTLGVALSLFVLVGSNSTILEMPSILPCFGAAGLILVFLIRPLFVSFKATDSPGEGNILLRPLRPWLTPLAESSWIRLIDYGLILLTLVVFGYMFVHNEKLLKQFWVDGLSMGDRAGVETTVDFAMGAVGLVLVLEATRRAIGWTLPLLSIAFIIYAFYGSSSYLPDWASHGGYDWKQVSQTAFLQSDGVFGTALRIMFQYVFLFVLFGTLLEQTGATKYIITTVRRWFQNSTGGPAKVAVISSGLMGSLSGSAVANTATTGTFTIPLMKSSGFDANTAGGIEAAASSGGALLPPIMGAGAYMMIELVPSVSQYLDVVKAAVLPAILYYLSVLLTVHFHAKRIGAGAEASIDTAEKPAGDETGLEAAETKLSSYQGFVFAAAFMVLIGCLAYGLTAFRSVTISMGAVALLSLLHSSTRLSLSKLLIAFESAAKSGVALIVAASCVGIILAVVTKTGLGNALPPKILLLSGGSTIAALLLLMVSTIVLGMGLPSVVCYLLMATLVEVALSKLATPDIAAHLFIFYFGMMSMVTPPVALAAYAAAAISKGDVMGTAFQAFRFALVGFALPFFFVLNPELLMLTPDGQAANWKSVLLATLVAAVAVYALAATLAGHGTGRLSWGWRIGLLVPSLVLFFLRLGDGWYAYGLLGVLVVLILIEHFRWQFGPAIEGVKKS